MASSEHAEQAGGADYQSRHLGAIFRQGFSFSGFERDLLCLNLGDKKYLDISGISGADSILDGRGSAFADLDNDGDLDVLLKTLQGEGHQLFRNNVGAKNGFLRVALEGARSGRDAFGAVVRVATSAGTLTKIKTGGSGYLSTNDPRLVFGLGADARVESVEVTWPSGAVQRLGPFAAGTSLRIVEGREEPLLVAERRFRLAEPLSREETVLARLGLHKGDRFPEVALRRPAGGEARLDALLARGRRTLVNLWATWCVPCAKEMPELDRLAPALRDRGVDVVGVSVDVETRDRVPAYLAERKIGYPIYVADEATVRRLFPRGEVAVPVSLLLDGNGRVLTAFAGWSRETEAALREMAGSVVADSRAR